MDRKNKKGCMDRTNKHKGVWTEEANMRMYEQRKQAIEQTTIISRIQF